MYKILVDSGCDLLLDYLQKHDIGLITLSYSVDDVEYADDGSNPNARAELYACMREGMVTKTSQPLQEDIYAQYKKYAEQNIPVVYVTLSSGISGTYSSACLARERCLEDFPNTRIEVVDSLCASGGYGLLIRRAIQERDNGKSFDEMVSWLNEKKHQLSHWFTVDDLAYLHRGGRVSKTVAVVGGVLKLKPVMRVDEDGHLVSAGIARGRKNSLKDLVNNVIEGCENYDDKSYEQTICIHHADALEDAMMCKVLLEANDKTKNVIVEEIGATIGCHSGPGTIAIFSFANTRNKENKENKEKE